MFLTCIGLPLSIKFRKLTKWKFGFLWQDILHSKGVPQTIHLVGNCILRCILRNHGFCVAVQSVCSDGAVEQLTCFAVLRYSLFAVSVWRNSRTCALYCGTVCWQDGVAEQPTIVWSIRCCIAAQSVRRGGWDCLITVAVLRYSLCLHELQYWPPCIWIAG